MAYKNVEINAEKLESYSKALGKDFAHAYAHMKINVTGQLVEAELKQLAENKDNAKAVLQYSNMLLSQIGQMVVPLAQGEESKDLTENAAALSKGVYNLLEGVKENVEKGDKEAYSQMSKLYSELSEAYSSNNPEKVKQISIGLVKILEESAKKQQAAQQQQQGQAEASE